MLFHIVYSLISCTLELQNNQILLCSVGKDAGRPRISVVERDSLVSTPETPRKSEICEPYSKLNKVCLQ